MEVYKIDEDTLRLIDESNVSGTEKVFNLSKSIQNYVNEHAED